MTENAWKIEEFKQCLEVVKTKKQCFSCSQIIPKGYQALNILGMETRDADSYACCVCCNEHLDQRLTRFLDQKQVKELRSRRVANAL